MNVFQNARKHRPTLNFEQPTDDVKVELAFCYYDNEATVAVFVGSGNAPVVVIPKEALEIALQQGWGVSHDS